MCSPAGTGTTCSRQPKHRSFCGAQPGARGRAPVPPRSALPPRSPRRRSPRPRFCRRAPLPRSRISRPGQSSPRTRSAGTARRPLAARPAPTRRPQTPRAPPPSGCGRARSTVTPTRSRPRSRPAQQALIDDSGVEYFINTDITFSTSSSASAAMSEASYTHSVAASTANGGTTAIQAQRRLRRLPDDLRRQQPCRHQRVRNGQLELRHLQQERLAIRGSDLRQSPAAVQAPDDRRSHRVARRVRPEQ